MAAVVVGSALVLLFVLVSIHGWFAGKASKPIADEYNRLLKQELEKERRANVEKLAFENKKLDQRHEDLEKYCAYLEGTRQAFSNGYVCGRKWLAHYIAEADRAQDEAIARSMKIRSRPALKASEQLAEIASQRRTLKEKSKFLEYQLASYKELFPFLEEYEEMILDEAVPLLAGGRNREVVEAVDPVHKYISIEEFKTLTATESNQLALDRYLDRHLSSAAIGRFYERFLGYQYEKKGWKVDYYGIVEGYEDLGRDLICRKNGRIQIIQAKCWAADKLIHEKHIFQLYGTTQLYLMNNRQDGLFPDAMRAVFVTSTSLSPVAKRAAEWLGIEVRENVRLDKSYPMIKCNINQSTKEKIFHLPFDQQYDRTKIIPELGECYVQTVADAEQMGFRRAFRHVNF